MPADFTKISVAARSAELPRLLGLLDDCAGRLGVAPDDVLRLQLIAEELFTNTVAHGHGGDSEAPVSLALGRDANGLCLQYSDAAPAFDPFDDSFEIGRKLPSTAAIGGWGIELVRGMARACSYRREDGRNVIDIEL